MKTKTLLCTLALLLSSLAFGQFQKNYGVAGKHHHDLNIEPIIDGSNDFIVAGNLFDPPLQNEELMIKRVDNSGNVVWMRTYSSPGLQHLRGFDIVTNLSMLFLTGSVDVAGVRQVFIAQIDATTGAVIAANYYTPVSANFNSRGLNIQYTESDADGDGSPDPGLIVSGFFSDCYNVDVNCIDNNIGLVIRTDLNLNEIWTIEIDTLVTNNPLDYDFANGVTETSNGFFITGSSTAQITPGNEQQGILAHKVDFMGNFVWDGSYYFGNFRDVSMDAYYDPGLDKIFMLANYSVSHYFGVTTYDNIPGTMDVPRTWWVSNNDLNRYGFTILESETDVNNLIITGYDRDENWVDGNGVGQFGQTNVFVYEFNKNSGVQVGSARQYLVPNTEPPGDDFNFWTGQMPLIYYPDISFLGGEPGQVRDYYHAGYRREPANADVRAELFRTPNTFINECDNLTFTTNLNAPNYPSVPVVSGFIPNSATPIVINDITPAHDMDICVRTLGASDIKFEKTQLYPNPAGNVIHIVSEIGNAYRITDALGRTVAERVHINGAPVSISQLRSGLYFVQLLDGQRTLETFKVIKK